MNHYNLQLLTNDRLAELRSEADRTRLAHSGHAEAPVGRNRQRTRQPRRAGTVLGSLLHRVALF